MEKKEKTIYEKLLSVQNELKAPKGQYNKFGNYKYRSCEDILEALKPILKEHRTSLVISDELVVLGNNNPVTYEETYYDKDLKRENTRTVVSCGERYYVKATATIHDLDSDATITNNAYAREEETKKGMDGSQITGTASSYARKYALNGLFLIDDTKDADTDEFHRTTQENGQKTNVATQPNQPPAKKIALTQKIVDEKLKFILEQTDTDTVKNIWLNLSKMYEINKDTALGGILFKATENKVLELTKNK